MSDPQRPPERPAPLLPDGNALLRPGESETAGTDSSPYENLSSDERAEVARRGRPQDEGSGRPPATRP
jgi:hypothetical protein